MSNSQKILSRIFKLVLDEIKNNEKFATKVERELLALKNLKCGKERKELIGSKNNIKRRHRRTPAVINPIEYARQGEKILLGRISLLSVEELKDIIAEYAMDPNKLAMKWKDKNKLISRITEFSMDRARKGDAFFE